MTVSVIVCPCDNKDWAVPCNPISKETCETLETARAIGEGHKKKGVAVIVRPNYNEEGFFREWRSFNGKPFKECRFPLDF